MKTIPKQGLIACWRGSADRSGSYQKKPGSQPPFWNGLQYWPFSWAEDWVAAFWRAFPQRWRKRSL